MHVRRTQCVVAIQVPGGTTGRGDNKLELIFDRKLLVSLPPTVNYDNFAPSNGFCCCFDLAV